jgi:RimJ/RimL family protein N-acetyltransferase
MVGHIRFHSLPDPDYLRPFAREAIEFGYHVFIGHRRQGYASEASNAAMDWAQAAFGIRRFIVCVSPNNVASLSVIARFGFDRIGEHDDETDGLEHIFLRELAA